MWGPIARLKENNEDDPKIDTVRADMAEVQRVKEVHVSKSLNS